MAVYPHGERSAVHMPKPAADRGNIHPGLNATCRKKVTQIVVGNASDFQFPAGAGERLLTFMHPADRFLRSWI